MSAVNPSSSQARPGRAIVDVVVAPPRGVHPEQDLAVQAVLDGPLQQLERAVRLLPAERLVVLAERAAPQQLAVIAAVDDLVDVAEGDVLGRDAAVGQEPELLEGARSRPRSGSGSARRSRGGRAAAASKIRRSRSDGPPSLPATLMIPARWAVRSTTGPL